jgi:hypothetical protein
MSSYLTIAAVLILVLFPLVIPVTVTVAQAVSDRRYTRWVARQIGAAGDTQPACA